VQAVGSDLEAVGRALEGSNELRLLMASPVVRPGRKAAILKELFGQRVGTIVLEFLLLLVRRAGRRWCEASSSSTAPVRPAGGCCGCTGDLCAPARRAGGRCPQGTAGTLHAEDRRLRLDVDSAIRGGLVYGSGTGCSTPAWRASWSCSTPGCARAATRTMIVL